MLGPRLVKPAHKRSLFLILGKKSTFVRGFLFGGAAASDLARRCDCIAKVECSLEALKVLASFPGHQGAPFRKKSLVVLGGHIENSFRNAVRLEVRYERFLIGDISKIGFPLDDGGARLGAILAGTFLPDGNVDAFFQIGVVGNLVVEPLGCINFLAQIGFREDVMDVPYVAYDVGDFEAFRE